MFTGIITDIGLITDIQQTPDTLITIQCHYDTKTIDIGASVACHGICLTVIEKTYNTLKFCLSLETTQKTTAHTWQVGQVINLERALKIGDELGGHIVTGHVDGIAKIIDICPSETSKIITIQPPQNLMPYIAHKGSVCLDGISLTVNTVTDNDLTVNIIPHTQQMTTWQTIQINDNINLEIDMMARYIARYVSYHTHKDE